MNESIGSSTHDADHHKWMVRKKGVQNKASPSKQFSSVLSNSPSLYSLSHLTSLASLWLSLAFMSDTLFCSKFTLLADSSRAFRSNVTDSASMHTLSMLWASSNTTMLSASSSLETKLETCRDVNSSWNEMRGNGKLATTTIILRYYHGSIVDLTCHSIIVGINIFITIDG